LGAHSYDPGFLPTDTFWITPVPEDAVEVDFDEGEAELRLGNVCVFDFLTVANSFDPAHRRGRFRAMINSLRIKWTEVRRTVSDFKDTTNRFGGDFLETRATIEVTATTPPETGQGFKFVSDAPETTETLFAQIGRERNGRFL